MHRHRLCKVLLGDMVNDRNKLKCYEKGGKKRVGWRQSLF